MAKATPQIFLDDLGRCASHPVFKLIHLLTLIQTLTAVLQYLGSIAIVFAAF